MKSKQKLPRLNWLFCLLSVALLGFLIGLQACVKNAAFEELNSRTYLRSFGDEQNDYAELVYELSNREILVIGSTYKEVRIDRFNEFGHLIAHDSFAKSSQDKLLGTKLRSGGFAISFLKNTEMALISNEGKLTFTGQFWRRQNSADFSSFCEGDNGSLYISYTNGQYTGSPGDNYISEVNDKGIELRYFKIIDKALRGKVLDLKVMRNEGDVFWLTGSIFANSPWSWSDRPKQFIAKYDGPRNKVTAISVLDLADNSESDFVINYANNSDGSFVTLVSGGYAELGYSGRNNPTFELIKITESLDIIWKKRYDIGALDVYPSKVLACRDGGFLTIGFCYTTGSNATRPYLLKTDKDGNVVLQKIFNFGGTSWFSSVEETQNGDFIFAGTTTVFGAGKEDISPFILRTDKNGNY